MAKSENCQKTTQEQKHNTSVFIAQEEIAEKVQTLGKQISQDYQNSDYIKIIVLLKGSFIFAADLLRCIEVPVRVDFMQVSSYGNQKTSSGNVRLLKDLSQDIDGEDVLIVEDIVDSGTTLSHIVEILKTRSPKSLQIVSLLVKQEKFSLGYPLLYQGFSIDDEFVIGYGLDFAEDFRQLPYIGIIHNKEIPDL